MNISWFSPDHWAVKSDQHHGLFGHSQREKTFTINANKFVLLDIVCAVDCNKCVKGAATAPNCSFYVALVTSCARENDVPWTWIMPAHTTGRTRLQEERDVPTWKHSCFARNLRGVKTLSSFLKLIRCQRALSTEKRFEIRSSTLVRVFFFF